MTKTEGLSPTGEGTEHNGEGLSSAESKKKKMVLKNLEAGQE